MGVDPAGALSLLLLGVWVALDGTSLGQFMVSRPLVAGTLAGFVLGDPGTGLLVGAILEVAHLGDLPAGGARLPEPGPGAVPAVWLAVAAGGGTGVAAGVALGAAWSLLGGASLVLLRRLNGRLTRTVADGSSDPRGLALRFWGCLALDAGRGAILVGSGLVAAGYLARALPPGAAHGFGTGELLLLLPGALAAGALLRGWSPSRRRVLLLGVGAAGGLALGLVLGGGG